MPISPLRTHPEFLAELGGFVILFSHVESNIKDFIASLADIKDYNVGNMIVAESPFKAIWSNLMSLYRYKIKDDKKIEVLEKILDEIDKINKVRNDIVHGSWQFSSQGILRIKKETKFAKGFKYTLEKYSIEKLQEYSDRLFKANSKLLDLNIEYERKNK